jgi:hypothetical protein
VTIASRYLTAPTALLYQRDSVDGPSANGK